MAINGGITPQFYRSRFGDTTLTKVFVGGLSWETPTEELRRFFETFGEVLEAVIITEKNTGRSKGYGFVTFRDPESANRSVADPNPLIDGRRANCNIAAQGRPKPLYYRGRKQGAASIHLGLSQPMGPSYTRLPAQRPPLIFPTPYGYMAYATGYGNQQGVYHSHLAPPYYHQMMYGLTVQSNGGAAAYQYHHHPQMNYMIQSSRTGAFPPSMLQAQCHLQPYDKDLTSPMEAEGSFFPPSSLPRGFQLQPPPNAKKSLNAALASSESEAPKQSLTTGGNIESSNV